jgi:hypothetical protein
VEDESPEAVVQAQVDAYNAHDTKAFAATYSLDAEIFDFPRTLLMKGRAKIEEHYGANAFNDPARHATIVKRIVMDSLVIDHERVLLTLPNGPGQMEAVVLYEVSAGRISKATLIRGQRVIGAKQQ